MSKMRRHTGAVLGTRGVDEGASSGGIAGQERSSGTEESGHTCNWTLCNLCEQVRVFS